MEARDSPAIYIAFDLLANSENLLGSPFRLRRKTLERFFEDSVPRSSPLYLSASTEDLREVEKWVGHIGQQLDGIIAKRADTPYRPGDDHSTVKIKNYRSADCVIGGFLDHVIGSARNELLLGLYDQKGHLQYVSSVGIDAKQKLVPSAPGEAGEGVDGWETSVLRLLGKGRNERSCEGFRDKSIRNERRG